MDQYVYYETDLINEVYFQSKGYAGFALPFRNNIIYIEIHNGNQFGEIDFVASAKECGISVHEIFDRINTEKINLVR